MRLGSGSISGGTSSESQPFVKAAKISALRHLSMHGCYHQGSTDVRGEGGHLFLFFFLIVPSLAMKNHASIKRYLNTTCRGEGR